MENSQRWCRVNFPSGGCHPPPSRANDKFPSSVANGNTAKSYHHRPSRWSLERGKRWRHRGVHCGGSTLTAIQVAKACVGSMLVLGLTHPELLAIWEGLNQARTGSSSVVIWTNSTLVAQAL